MIDSKLTSYIGKGLATSFLVGTLFTGTAQNSFGQTLYPQAEQKISKQTINNKLAVLLIDMQEIFLKDIFDEERKREIPYQIEVLDYCKANDIPVFVLEYEREGSTIPVLKDKIDSLNKKSYIIKSHSNGFEGTDLEKQLKFENAENLLLMGINASACVLETAEGALERGYNLMTSKDLIADSFGECYDPESDVLESRYWYKKNSIYRDNYKDLLQIISEGTIEENLPTKR